MTYRPKFLTHKEKLYKRENHKWYKFDKDSYPSHWFEIPRGNPLYKELSKVYVQQLVEIRAGRKKNNIESKVRE